MGNNERVNDLISNFYEASVDLDEEEFTDKKPAVLAKAGLRLMALLLHDYNQGNEETSTLFCELVTEMFTELKRKEDECIQFDRFLDDVNLG